MKGYTQLTQEEKYQIHAFVKAGHNQTEVATVLGCDKSTISCELVRNRELRGYRPKQAHQLSVQRQQIKARARICCAAGRTVEHLLREDWGPEQIILWIEKQDGMAVSHEWIWQFLLQDKRQGAQCSFLFCPSLYFLGTGPE